MGSWFSGEELFPKCHRNVKGKSKLMKTVEIIKGSYIGSRKRKCIGG